MFIDRERSVSARRSVKTAMVTTVVFLWIGLVLAGGMQAVPVAAAELPAFFPWDLAQLERAPEFRWLDESSPIRSLTFRNESFRGEPTEVFAFYATPGTLSGDPSRDTGLPGVVLIHGGGGTAFAEWVELWAGRGYAAIAMDLSGRRPAAPQFHAETRKLLVDRRAARTRLDRGGPEADHEAKFQRVGGDISDDWQYHAVAAVIRSHSLLRSFPEVDATRTAVTGISWGGYLTCLVASIDDRFKAAVPVYGCGFLYDGESVQKALIDRLPAEQRATWIRQWDPSAWLKHCRVPIFFVNGTNDKHYPLDSYRRSYDLVSGPKQIRIEVNMRHSHVAGWAPHEIGRFIDQHVNGGNPLPSFADPVVSGRKAMAKVQADVALLANPQLHFTTDDGPLVQRQWTSVPAALRGSNVVAQLPEGVTIWLLSIEDPKMAMVSTRPSFTAARVSP